MLQIVIYMGSGGRDFRFFEKKLGKKLPCMDGSPTKLFFDLYEKWLGYRHARKLLLRSVAKFFSKSDNASPASPTNHNFPCDNKICPFLISITPNVALLSRGEPRLPGLNRYIGFFDISPQASLPSG